MIVQMPHYRCDLCGKIAAELPDDWLTLGINPTATANGITHLERHICSPCVTAVLEESDFISNTGKKTEFSFRSEPQ